MLICPQTPSPRNAAPWPFDLNKIDTCEEAMFAPGADMLVKALVGEEEPVRVTFRCGEQNMDYVQDAQGVRGTINGKEFSIQRSLEQGKAHFLGDTPAGPMDGTTSPEQPGTRTKGLAGTVQYDHRLMPGEEASGTVAEVAGKFG